MQRQGIGHQETNLFYTRQSEESIAFLMQNQLKISPSTQLQQLILTPPVDSRLMTPDMK